MSPQEIQMIIARLDGLKELFEDKFERNNKDHKELIGHQKTTNGRVNKLESWRDRFMGALIITQIILIPLAVIYIGNNI